MKRFIANLYLFILCCVLVYPFNIKEVSAAEEDIGSNYVYYQALVSKNNTYKSFSAVSQFFYTNTAHLGKTGVDGESNLPIANRSTFSSLYDVGGNQETLCSVFSNYASDLYCNNGIIKPLASLKISATGLVSMKLSNEVTLGSLQIYYLLANRVGDLNQHMYCQNSNGTTKICDNATHVISTSNGANAGNWSNRTKDGVGMHFTEVSITNKFTKTETQIGETIYSGYDIFKDMEQGMAELAEASGVYVLTSFSVKYGERMYYVNNYALKKTFSSEATANINATTYKSVIINSNPTDVNSNSGQAINQIPSNAALVKPATDSSNKNNRGFALMENFFEDTLRPILIIAIGVLFVIVGTHTGVTIVKSSDEPEVRKEAIKKFGGLFVGAFTIAIILIFYKDIITAVKRFF